MSEAAPTMLTMLAVESWCNLANPCCWVRGAVVVQRHLVEVANPMTGRLRSRLVIVSKRRCRRVQMQQSIAGTRR